jgi:hypothetical protein
VQFYADTSVDHGSNSSDTLVWLPRTQLGLGELLVDVHYLDKEKVNWRSSDMLMQPASSAKHAIIFRLEITRGPREE